ncbi:DUF2059 domain-containing protein [Roseovarius sp. A21]|uniref:DUF2059 domain-containing protein n=1 Tax=Roseovarius bejariae TaxID=2576383 RepID=A0A844CGY8_9RHOB|nr:DUF2059 domain-containing protein [Roseovarius bejariae]MRU13952.1 DUF2059 domain-containing protein [Roseovarius bejariae]
MPRVIPMPRLMMLLLPVLLVVMQAGPLRAADRDRLEAFLEVTGFGVALDSLALSAADAPRMLGMEASDFGSDWERVANEVFDTGEMRKTALDILSQTLSEEDLAHAAGFYASDLGQRLVEVENASHMVEDDSGKREDGEERVTAMMRAGDTRLQVIKGLNAAIDQSGNAVRAVQEVQVRFLMAASHAGVLERAIDEESLRALLKQGENELRIQLKAGALANAAYTYADISTEDLDAYREALEHPRMQRVYELMNAVQFEIMAGRYERLAARMADLHPGQEL